ncbi:MAG: 4-phosphoerythronate dehydrogenase [Porphyromonadaceae bacterium]|nr:4-phosphoerythronate dehydrogenase [Porphyromonadaceae bacterium]
MKLRLVIESSIPYLRGVAECIGEVTYLDNADFSAHSLAQADALIVRSITRCDSDLLAGTPIRFIATATAGADHIDAEYCRSAGITWVNSPGCNATAVAQYVMSSLSRLSLEAGEPLEGKTIGIVGVGHVGREVLRLSLSMGLKPLLYDPPRAEEEGDEAFCSLEQIQHEADIITLHVPLTLDGRYPTCGMVDDHFVAQCRRNPILINACRGAVTHTESLIRGKKQGVISRLIIDCWEGEPQVSLDLLALADIATPHIAGFSADGKFKGARMSLQAVAQYYGQPGEGLFDPDAVPAPEHPLLDATDIPESECLRRAMLHSFDPIHIDRKFRTEPSRFEYLRKHYDYPREMQAYTVLAPPSEDIASRLRALGFAIRNN